MTDNNFIPQHLDAIKDDFVGNGKWGRYIILPGSDGRAKSISKLFKNLEVKNHPRAHNLYKGILATPSGEIDIATISTGMGAASADIIINELNNLGAKNLIRVGTAGSLQHSNIKCGSVVIPTGSVRDESTTSRYIPIEVPAVPSLDFLIAAKGVTSNLKDKALKVFFGQVHSKDSLYAREFLYGPKKEENKTYMEVLKNSGILASEMETSLLFSLGELFAHQHKLNNEIPCITGAVLAIIGDDSPFGKKDVEEKAVENSIDITIKIIEMLHRMRNGKNSLVINLDI